jgi:hypothetical protein
VVLVVVVLLAETISFFCVKVDVDPGVGVDDDDDASERCS